MHSKSIPKNCQSLYACQVIPNVSIRALASLSDQELGRMIFDETWPMDGGTEITPGLMQAMVHGGAYLSGAFIDGNCIGAAFAFPATTGGKHLHSHMAAVVDGYRDKGVGYALKVDQYQWARKNNYPEITWTFDPLVARNAKFNLLKLGVDILAYHPNFYGAMSDSVNAGDESDRFMASWKVVGETPTSRSAITEPSDSAKLIEIPNDIVAVRNLDPVENLRWRRKVREEFMEVLSRGGKVVGFSENNEYVVEL
jgi:predicted GNAT superfamily acetyltransferase